MFIMLIKLIALALSVMFTGYIVPGISVSGFKGAIFTAVIIIFINYIIKPVFLVLMLPINVLTLGISILFINAFLFLLAAKISPGIHIENFSSAFLGALVLSFLSIFIAKI